MCLSHIREGLREAARAKAEAEFERDVEVQVEAMRRFATEQNREAVRADAPAWPDDDSYEAGLDAALAAIDPSSGP